MNEKIPVKDGMIKVVDGQSILLGSKCSECGQAFFPTESLCLNCGSEMLDEITLSRKGTLYSYSAVEMPCANFKPPYAVGFVDMPEGVRIFGQLDIKEKLSFKIGMEMEIYVDTLWQEGGKDIIGYRFSPL